MNKISTVLIVRNEEKKIRRCLESIKWCDEIVVVDQSSEDKTVEIVKEYTTKIYITEPKLICNPDREFGISKTSNEWILLIEADEVVDDNLKEEIKDVIQRSESEVYMVPVKTFFSGRWIKTCGWYPSYIPRLFKKGKINFQNEIHTNGVILTNKVGYLRNPLLHYSYEKIDDWIDKFKRYTTQYANEYMKKRIKINFTNTFKELIIRPLYFFILKFFVLKGYIDGWRGFFISLSSALTVIFSYLKYIELKEMRRKK
ncbi:MAG: glycosyltransferase family 2 protein [Endomicrobia bacterium]|nr:glycosyltransferase family 2 protein [Endomicrobiia bacterium]